MTIKVKGLGAAVLVHGQKLQTPGSHIGGKDMASHGGLIQQAKRRAFEVKNGLNPGEKRAASLSGDTPPLGAARGRKAKQIALQADGLQRRLEPGDILNTNPRKILLPHHRLFKRVSKASQGTVFGHSVMYVGNGDVVDPRANNVERRTLKQLAMENKIIAMRPAVDGAARQAAARFMARQVGDKRLAVATKSLFRHGAMPTFLSDQHEGRRQDLIDRAICSSLIANAYAKVPFNRRRSIANTRPVDILRSDKIKVVGKIT